MGLITKTKTWADNDNVTYTDINANFDSLYNLANGSISNANVDSSADIDESKINFDTTSGHSHNGTDSRAIGKSFTWGIKGTLATGNEQGMKYIAPNAMTVTSLRAKTGSGTATIRIQTDTTDIDTAASVTSTAGNITTFDSTAIAAGEVVTLDITAVSSAEDLFVTLTC